MGGCYRAVELDVSGEGIKTELEEATFEEVDNLLSLVDEAWATGGLLGNQEFAPSQVYCALCCTVLATECDTMWSNGQLEVASLKFRRVQLQYLHKGTMKRQAVYTRKFWWENLSVLKADVDVLVGLMVRWSWLRRRRY